MDISIFASGSSGNCMLLSEGDTYVLIDAGISMKRISESLGCLGLTLKDISGVFITHEHSDHILALKMLLKYYNIPVYAPHTLANRLRGMLPNIEQSMHIIKVGSYFSFGNFEVLAFHTPHDTDESVGYRFDAFGSFAIATDMGHVSDEVFSALLGAETVLLESNHDIEMLRCGSYPYHLKKRILSDNGHLSNDDCAKLVSRLVEHGTRRVILGHLSKENNLPELALAASRPCMHGNDTELYCAPRLGLMSFSIGGGNNADC